MTVQLVELLERAKCGHAVGSDRLFKPSWFYYLLEDPFWLWCHYHAPSDEQVDETTRFDRYQMEAGNQWEERYIAANYPASVDLTVSHTAPVRRSRCWWWTMNRMLVNLSNRC
jgi:hypothetical protein